MPGPLTGNIDLRSVNTELLMLDGATGLSDVKLKDFVKKTNTSVGLRDFDKKIWGQGRTMVRSQYDTDYFRVRPYHWDRRYDNIAYSSVTNTVEYVGDNGSPSWLTQFESRRDIPTAVYNCGFTKVDVSKNRNYRLRVHRERVSGMPKQDASYTTAQVYTYTDNYLQGTQYQWLGETNIDKFNQDMTFDFQVGAAQNAPYMQIVVRHRLSEWNGVMGYERYASSRISNFEVYEI